MNTIPYGKTSKQLVLVLSFILYAFLTTAHGQESWRTDFDETCARTTDAMSLSNNELKVLIAKCDQLQTIIEKQEETVRKVFLKRLQMCKNLYVYVLESKSASEKTPK
ncbi:MAG: hypothetical protein JJE30_14995 [Desulfuromonadales bacterium]|nr:hypothetical protein [Desulfuromonadales bacterium]